MSGCVQCGKCCMKYGMRLEASPLDIARWNFDGRDDILRHVGLEYDAKGEIEGGVLWVNEDGSRADACPFLTEKAGLYYCSIQEIKPEVCTYHFCARYEMEL
jgi:Fe-S-cluster containining protein